MKNQKAQRGFVKDSNQHRDLVKEFYDQDIDHKALEKALTKRKNTAKGFTNFSLDPYTGELNLVIPGEDRETTITIYSRSGRMIKRYQRQIPFSRIVTVNTTELRTDVYVIKVNGQTVEQTFKIIKR